MLTLDSLRLEPGSILDARLNTSLRPASEPERMLRHRQMTLHINGTVHGAIAHANEVSLEVSLFIRGARWRTTVHRLCTATQPDPQVEWRECALGEGPFSAALFVLVPGNRPRYRLQRRKAQRSLPALRDATSERSRLLIAARELESINVCAPHLRLSAELLRGLCGGGGGGSGGRQGHGFASPLLLLSGERFGQAVYSQTSVDEWRAVGAAALLALVTLPRPFALVESGNLCGAMTVLLAILKRQYCPACELHSLDPGSYREVIGQPPDCAERSLAWAGVRDEVRLYSDAGGAVELGGLPVGFIYLDDGKTRFSNEPLLALATPRMLIGGVVAFDDSWQVERLPNAVNHLGQMNMVHELVVAGDFEPLMLPVPRNGSRADIRARSGRRHYALLAKAASQAPSPFATHKTSAVRKTRSWLTASLADSTADAVRVSAIGRDGKEVAVRWMALPLRDSG